MVQLKAQMSGMHVAGMAGQSDEVTFFMYWLEADLETKDARKRVFCLIAKVLV